MKKILLLILTVNIFIQSTVMSQCWEKISEYQNGELIYYDGEVVYMSSSLGSNSLNLSKSLDNGISWNLIEIPTDVNYNQIYFYNSSFGFLVGENLLAKTTDGGLTWSAPLQNNNYDFARIYFYNDNIGFLLTEDRSLFKSLDGGENWDLIANLNSYLTVDDVSIHFFNEQVGIIPSISRLLKTTDGGQTWNFLDEFRNSTMTTVNSENKAFLVTKKNLSNVTSHVLEFDNNTGELISEKDVLNNVIPIANCKIASQTSDRYYAYNCPSGLFLSKNRGLQWENNLYNAVPSVSINSIKFYQDQGIASGGNNIYKNICSPVNHSEDFFDICSFSYDLNSITSNVIELHNNNSRSSTGDGELSEFPSCWINSEPSSGGVVWWKRAYWFKLIGDGELFELKINSNNFDDPWENIQAVAYKGKCTSSNIEEVIDCDEINSFNNEINLSINTDIGEEYYIALNTYDFDQGWFRILINGATNTDDKTTKNDIRIFPNPVNTMLNIDLPISESRCYSVFNMTGKLVKEMTKLNTIDFTDLNSGVYIIEIKENNKVYFEKIIKI